MQAFINRYENFILSVFVLLVGLFAAGYSVGYSKTSVHRQELQALNRIISQDNKAIDRELKRIRELKESESPTEGINSLPEFLRHINALAEKTDVIIRRLSPTESESVTAGAHEIEFDLEIATDYFTFLSFASLLESLNVVINNLQVHPFDPTQDPPLQAIAFSITPRLNAEPLAGERLERLTQRVEEKEKRNPFRILNWDRKTLTATLEIDLTWIHRLSGIGRIGAQYFATIDGRDYRVGNEFLPGMFVKTVTEERVTLERVTDNGTQPYVLKFRSGRAPG